MLARHPLDDALLAIRGGHGSAGDARLRAERRTPLCMKRQEALGRRDRLPRGVSCKDVRSVQTFLETGSATPCSTSARFAELQIPLMNAAILQTSSFRNGEESAEAM
jgi:hypothetical protein